MNMHFSGVRGHSSEQFLKGVRDPEKCKSSDCNPNMYTVYFLSLLKRKGSF